MAGTIDVGTIKVGGLAELKAQLREIKGELANATDPEQMRRLAEAAGEVSDQIKDANEQVAVFATGSKFEATSNAFGLMKNQLMSLDFEGAATSAKLFQQTLGSITPAQIGTQLKGLISVVGSLTKAFIQFGISLLANPIFLLVAAVVAITVAIIALMNKFGLLKPILDAIGKAFDLIMQVIDAAIQAFKDLTDWLGLTANAAEDSAARQIKAAEEASKANKERSEAAIDAMDFEIAKMKAMGKDTAILEVQRQKEIRNTAKEEARLLQTRISAHEYLNNISKDELQKLKDSLKEQTKLVNDASQEIALMRINNQKKVEDNAKKVAENEKKINEQRAADSKKYAEDRRNAIRLEQDLELELMDEGIKRDLKANQLKYQRLIEDTKLNEKLNGEERKKIIQEYTLIAADTANDIRKTYAQKEIDAEKAKQAKILEQQKAFNDRRIQAEDEYFKLKQELEYLNIAKSQGTEAAAKQKEIDDLIAKYEEKFAVIQEKQAAQIALTGEDSLATQAVMLETSATEKALTEQQKIDLQAINDKYAEEAKKKEEQERIDKIENVNKTTQMMGDATKTGLQGISDIVGAFAGKSVSQQKKAFEIQKKINIVMATIDMIKGAVSAFSNAQTLGPIAGPIVGSLIAASVVASGIANIKKISATKFEGGGTTSPSAPSTTGGGESASATAGPAQPSFSLFGQPNQANTMTGAKSVEGGQTTIQAVVVESEITTSQNKVKRMQESATL